ncbi:VOC family protein [Sulfitobacter sp. F26169L]|uniref:VOC family protein n=1 Tax=Sulfitobacter sp. F26169L TaxID=2996015 RepID=UPI002260C4A1|nr:VOC family protein [Sulfitobacter sp. F26169L]MCX7565650.1 VOC family protein [Sulfitobacter sp. F26169L]
MTVRRIVFNVATQSLPEVVTFYRDLLNLDVVMDLGWIATLASQGESATQISIASEGGSGTPVPDLSIEVDDVNATHQRAQDLGLKIEYPLTDEPWGVRRFYVVDPEGKVLNILTHIE